MTPPVLDRASPVRLGRSRTSRRVALPPWWWTVPVAVLVVTFLATLPTGFARHGELTELLLPDARWTLAGLRADLDTIGVPAAGYALAVHAGGVLFAASFLLVAVLVGFRRPRERGPLVVSLLLAAGGWSAGGTHTVLSEEFPDLAASLQVVGVAMFGALTVLAFVFPDGRFQPRWTLGVVAVGLSTAVLAAVPEGPVPTRGWGVAVVDAGVVVLALVSQGIRFRRADPVARQQTKWVAWSLGVFIGTGIGWFALSSLVPELTAPGPTGLLVSTAGNGAFALAGLLIPLAVGFSVTRHRLWDVDALINRTVVGAALTLSSVAVYLLVAVAVDSLLRVDSAGALLAAGAVAVLLQPTRHGVQRLVNRFSFGDRDVPHVVLARLTDRIGVAGADEAEVLQACTSTIESSLRLSAVGVEVFDQGGRPRWATPAPAWSAEEVDLVWHGERVGRLRVPGRTPGEPLGPRDRRLVDVVTPHLTAAAVSLRTSWERQETTRRMVTTVAAERRRLRRHLHDEVGPDLAAVAMDLDVATSSAVADPRGATALVTAARERLGRTVGSVRELAYALYPPELEQLGLEGAVRDLAETQLGPAGTALELHVDLDRPLGAAVEVAAYRIVGSAVRNVARHAAASHTRVLIVCTAEHLEIEVSDDGIGPVGSRPGAGLLGMRERALELGGTFRLDGPPGTRVRVRLPLDGQD